jgi:biotin carboxyl carrier protein
MARTVILRSRDNERRVSVESPTRVSIDGTSIPVQPLGEGAVRVEGRPAWVASSGDVRWVYLDGEVYEMEVVGAGGRRRGLAGHGLLSAPMPATVVRVEVSPGSRIRRGDTLIILEAMKMELPIRASADGIVKAVHCTPGDLVQPGVPLVEVE